MVAENEQGDDEERAGSGHAAPAADPVDAAYACAHAHAQKAYAGTDKAYDDGRKDNGLGQQGKGKAHGQGVYARGHGQEQNGPACGGIRGAALVFLFKERFVEQLSSHKDEQNKGNPVIPLFDEVADTVAQKPARERHQGLKDAEGKGHAQILACGRALQGHA